MQIKSNAPRNRKCAALFGVTLLAPCMTFAEVHGLSDPPMHRVSHQGRIILAEIIGDDVFIEDDVLAFSDDIKLLESAPPQSSPATLETPDVSTPEPGTNRLWRRTRLSYSFDPRLAESIRSMFRSGASIWASSTSWELIETTNRSSADIIVRPHASRCAANTGAPPDGKQSSISLSNQCTLRSMVHEIGHVIGMNHEHQRPDRDGHLKIRMDTMQYIRQNYPGSTYQLVVANLRPLHYNPGQPYAFDEGSIMMYGSYPQREPLRSDLLQKGLPFYTRKNGTIIDASPAQLSNKDIATAEYLATLISTIHGLTPRY